MSSKHLQTGDTKPPFDVAKKFRIYSMAFCPYAQRPRLVVAAKGLVDLDIVNVKLRTELPEWYPAINPSRTVPAIEFPNGETIGESLVVSDLIDEMFPEKQLHSKDPVERAKQKLLINKYDKTLIPSFYKYMIQKTDEAKVEFVKNLSNAEKYLVDNKSKYFSGNQVGMADYMIWPWFERTPAVYSLSADQHPNLSNWFNLMKNDTAVKATQHSTEKHSKFYEGYFSGKAQYDF